LDLTTTHTQSCFSGNSTGPKVEEKCRGSVLELDRGQGGWAKSTKVKGLGPTTSGFWELSSELMEII